MKRVIRFLGFSCLMLAVLMVFSTAQAASGAKFSLQDVPEIKNKAALNTIVETGQVWDKIMPYIEAFTKKTGVKVNVERVASPVVYSKENVELMGGTGYYDVVYVETAWTTEWSAYLHKLEELAKKYDPAGVEGFRADIVNHSPSILICGQAYGDQMVLPFYTYHMSMFIRQDVFDDPTEQANFKAKYGYDLKPAATAKELNDQGEFFTRKKGDTLKGKPLQHDHGFRGDDREGLLLLRLLLHYRRTRRHAHRRTGALRRGSPGGQRDTTVPPDRGCGGRGCQRKGGEGSGLPDLGPGLHFLGENARGGFYTITQELITRLDHGHTSPITNRPSSCTLPTCPFPPFTQHMLMYPSTAERRLR